MPIRPLRWWDVPTLVRAEHEIFGADAWSSISWWSELAQHANGRRYLAYFDGTSQLLGYAGIQLGLESEIMTLAVLPQARGQGIARQLLRQLLIQAKAEGATAVLLEVRADNAAAQALYQSFGFTRLALRRGYYQTQTGSADAHIMRLRPLAEIS